MAGDLISFHFDAEVDASGKIFTRIGLMFKDAENAPDIDSRVNKASELFLKAAETEESVFSGLLEDISQ